VPERPLWSERQGGSLPLTEAGFGKLIEHLIARCRDLRLFEEGLGIGEMQSVMSDRSRGKHNAEVFFTYRLGEPHPASVLELPTVVRFRSDDQTFDVLELLFREIVSLPHDPHAWPAKAYNREEGQQRFRDLVNPVLARRDPPLELDERGTIVQRVAEPMRRLIEQPLPESAPKREVLDRVDDAIAHYRRRQATAGDRRAAVRELADVLEFLRADVKQHMLSKDESDLFRIANEFALRHNKPTTRRDFDEPVWLAWLFYVYLATIRLTLELSRRDDQDVAGA
jgi:hypothetical protein